MSIHPNYSILQLRTLGKIKCHLKNYKFSFGSHNKKKRAKSYTISQNPFTAPSSQLLKKILSFSHSALILQVNQDRGPQSPGLLGTGPHKRAKLHLHMHGMQVVCNNPPTPVCGRIVFHDTSPWCQKDWGPMIYGMISVCFSE